jgi:hypothetical protein
VADSDADSEGQGALLLAFIEAQTKRLKKADLEELPALELSRAAAALAAITAQEPPDPVSTAFVAAWRRTDQCHHFWGPTVGQERFCTKCQVPKSAAADEQDTGPTRRRR